MAVKALAIFRSRRMAVLFALGFASGLPLTSRRTVQLCAHAGRVRAPGRDEPPLCDVVAAVDWSGFFVVTSAMAVPGLVLAALVVRRTAENWPGVVGIRSVGR